MNADPKLDNLVRQAKADVGARLGVSPDALTLKKAEPVEWPDTSLGCPQKGMFYAQVVTPGYLIVLEANGKEYEYHASLTSVVLCEK